MGASNLKRGHGFRLWSFLVAHIAIYSALALNEMNVLTSVAQGAWTMSLAPITVLLLNGLLPPKAKAAVVFWRFRHPLPGSRAFTVHGPQDQRVDMSALTKAFGSLPANPLDQNRLWYKMLKQVEEHGSVRDAHSNYLLARDLTATAVLALGFLAPAALIITRGSASAWIYIGFLFVQYVVIALAAQRYGIRLVCNVLAETAAR